jgi:hypothetical protein
MIFIFQLNVSWLPFDKGVYSVVFPSHIFSQRPHNVNHKQFKLAIDTLYSSNLTVLIVFFISFLGKFKKKTFHLSAFGNGEGNCILSYLIEMHKIVVLMICMH